MKQLFFAVILLMNLGLQTQAFSAEEQPQRKCLYINSYHKGYEWSDGIQEAALKALKGHCSVEVFYMDAKHNDSVEHGQKKGLEAKSWIESQSPDLVIVADDAAVEYVLKDHFKDQKLPFVFCGINWEASKYGLPYQNATGMIEVSPVEGLLNHIKEINPKAKSGIFLAGDVSTDRRNYQSYSDFFQKHGIELKPAYAKTMQNWEKMYLFSQRADFLIVANHSGIQGWSFDKAKEIVRQNTKIMTVAYHEFMKSLAALSVTKSPHEQGHWAAQVAIEILKGTPPNKIPVAVNRKWKVFVNEDVSRLSRTKIPESVSRKATKVSL